jgi:transposase
MKSYSDDFREKIVNAYRNGEGSLRKIAKRFSVSLNFVWLLIKRERETGSVSPKPHGGGQKPKIDGIDVIILRRLVKENNDATLLELRELFYQETGIEVSVSTIGRTLGELGWSRKKKTFHATERDEDEDVQQARQAYQEQMPSVPAEKLIFVDETGTNRGMARTYARAPVGQRAQGAKPSNPGKNISLIGAMGIDGVTAAFMLEGSVDAEVFKAFVEKVLAPTLREGDIVLMDNLKAHKVKGIEDIIRSKGATLQYLPSYSPDFSPIEPCWSKIKESLRSTAARTLRALEKGVKKALNSITESDARGWFNHCGYCIERN